jgi:diguanylate cyclase (GGDEF)-like protein
MDFRFSCFDRHLSLFLLFDVTHSFWEIALHISFVVFAAPFFYAALLAERKISYLAYYDSLTSLPNRSLFNDRLRVALAQAKRNQQTLAIMFLDLDRFKWVNDTLGHHAGDQLLTDMAKRLATCFREGDTIARMGRDEFAVILPNITYKNTTKVAERILEQFHDPFVIKGQECFVTSSIGISIFPDDGEELIRLSKRPTLQCTVLKKQGRMFTNFIKAIKKPIQYAKLRIGFLSQVHIKNWICGIPRN